MSERVERGRAVYARVFAVPENQVETTFAARTGAAFANEALEAAGGLGQQSPSLSARDRSIAVLTALVAQGVTDDRLTTHLALARGEGIDDDALTTLMALLAIYIGYPYTSQAMETLCARSSE